MQAIHELYGLCLVRLSALPLECSIDKLHWYFRVSASNNLNAQIYNLEYEHAAQLFPASWEYIPELTTVLVWDAFFIYTLLQDCQELGRALVMSNEGEQAERLQPVLIERTARLVGPGREYWNHACDKCCYEKRDDAGFRESFSNLPW